MRRRLAVLAAVPLILTAAACGSADTGGTSKATSGVTVTGNVGTKPTVTFPSGSPATKSSFQVLNEGNGAAVKAGDSVKAHLTVYDWDGKSNPLQGSSYDSQQPEEIPVDTQLPQVLRDGLTKVKLGGRLLAVMAADAAPAGQQQAQKEPTKIFVLDPVSMVPKAPADAPKAAKGTETGETLKGVKVVSPGGDKAPTLTTKTSDKPGKELVVKTLIKGGGQPVKPNDYLMVQYTGKIWGTDKEFDSSWAGGQPATFELTKVIPGWQEGLKGVPVGSRVVMSIPPDKGYGAQEQQGIPANSTLVFVVDVLAAYQ
jgi:FKBP-type peptidyl-prolyl cis-trans isomerase